MIGRRHTLHDYDTEHLQYRPDITHLEACRFGIEDRRRDADNRDAGIGVRIR